MVNTTFSSLKEAYRGNTLTLDISSVMFSEFIRKSNCAGQMFVTRSLSFLFLFELLDHFFHVIFSSFVFFFIVTENMSEAHSTPVRISFW